MSGEPINLGIPPLRGYRASGNRMVKMSKPSCPSRKDENGEIIFEGCQDSGVYQWWNTCTHGPYTSTVERRNVKTLTEDMEDGTRRVTGKEEIRFEVETPNLVQVPLSLRVNSGRSIDNKKALGYLMPEDLGFASFCQFVDCWSQEITHRTAYGNYCCEWQAKTIAADENEDKLEILDAKKRQRQLAQVAV